MKKRNDPNARRKPVILIGPTIERSKAATLVEYGVVKYFTKPIRFDVFFEAIGSILRQSFSFDETPCILDIHINGNLIFVEIARGLNRENFFNQIQNFRNNYAAQTCQSQSNPYAH